MSDIKFKFLGDDTELRKKLAEMARIQSTMNEQFSKSMGSAGSDVLSKSIQQIGKDAINAAKEVDSLNKTAIDSKLKDAKLAEIESIKRLREERSKEISDLNTLKQIESEAKTVVAEKQLATEKLVQAEKRLSIELNQGSIDLNKYNLELKKSAEERRKATEEERKAEKALRENEKARKDAEREAAKQAKELEKRKKQLEQESSEYYKLNKALYAVRKETKDVLAEMFRMERQGHKNTAGYEALRKKAEGLTKQTQYLDQGIKKIDATLGLHQRNVGNYGQALEAISPQFASINQKLQIFGTSIDQLASKPGAIRELGAAFASMGKAALVFIMSPIGLVITAFAALFMLFKNNKQTVIDFNSGLLNVSKTTGIAGAELQVLSDSIIQLSRSLKTVSTDKLLEYATIAGQLGVKGPANIMAFSEALAKLETASDISGEEGGKGIARLLTLVDGGVQNVKSFGDEIVNLGNNFAASEKEILGNAEAISQNVGLYKVGRQDVLAYATATKALGMEAEVVGSAFQKTLGIFEKSIRSGKGVSDVLRVVGGSAAELQARFKTDSSGVFQDYIKGLNGIYKAGGSVQAQMERNGITDIRQKRIIGTLAVGYETLESAMNTAKEASGALDQEFATSSGKLVEQTKRIGIAWDNLVLGIENGSGAIGKSSVAIIGFFADIIDSAASAEGRLNKLFASKFFSEEFWLRVSSLTTAPIEYFLGTNASGEEADKVKFDKDRMTHRRSKHYNQNLDFGKSIYKYFDRKEKGLIINEKPVVRNTTPDDEESDKNRLKRERAEEAAARKAQQIAEQGRQAQERQRALQLSIDKAGEVITRRQLTRDEQEIESVKDKYTKIREEVRKFYDDPKNKGLKVDTGSLISLEKFETEEAERRVLNRATIADIEEKKELYAQFEQYKLSLGIDKATELMRSQIDTSKTYLQFVEQEFGKAIVVDPTQMTAAQKEFYESTAKMAAEAGKQVESEQVSKLINLIKLSETTELKIADIRKKYSDAYEILEGEKTRFTLDEYEKRKEALKKGQSEEIGSVLLPELQKSGDWVNVFEKNAELARSKVLESVNSLRDSLDKMLANGEITIEEFNEKIKQIKGVEVQVKVNEKGFGRLKQALTDLKKYDKDSIKHDEARQKLGQEINYWGQGIVDAGEEALNIADQLGVGSEKFKEDMALSIDLASNAVNLATSIASGDVVGMVTNGIKTISSAINLFTKDRKIDRKIKEYQEQLLQLGKTYETLARKMSDSDSGYYENSNNLLKNLDEQERKVKQMMAAEDSKKKSDKGKMKSYEDQLKAIKSSREDLEKEIRQMRLQTDINSLAQSITDALVGAFEAGENGIDAMDNAFEKFIKNSVANSARLKFVQKIIDDMLNQVDKYMASNDNSVVGFDFAPWEKKLNTAGKEVNDFLESAYAGLGLTKDKDKQGELSKGIQGVTETTANRLEAEFGGLRLAQLELLDVTKSQGFTLGQQLSVANSMLNELVAINNNTYRTANNTNELFAIREAIVSLNNKVGNNDAARRAGGL